MTGRFPLKNYVFLRNQFKFKTNYVLLRNQYESLLFECNALTKIDIRGKKEQEQDWKRFCQHPQVLFTPPWIFLNMWMCLPSLNGMLVYTWSEMIYCENIQRRQPIQSFWTKSHIKVFWRSTAHVTFTNQASWKIWMTCIQLSCHGGTIVSSLLLFSCPDESLWTAQ